MTRPRDVRIGLDRPKLLWHKRKWHCRVPECERKVFTERTARADTGAGPDHYPGPPGRRRSRSVTRARPVSWVADEFGMDWRIAHEAFVAYADQLLPAGPPPVTGTGHRRDPPREGQATRSRRRPGQRCGWTGSIPAWSIWAAPAACSRRSTAEPRMR